MSVVHAAGASAQARTRSSPPAGSRTVLQVIDLTNPGGAQQVVLELSRSMAGSGWRPVAALPDHDGWLADHLRHASVPLELTPCTGGGFDRGYLLSLVRAVRRTRADVIHAHLLGPAVYASLAGLLTRRPVVATFHGQVDISTAERFLAAKTWLINQACGSVVFVSDALRVNLLEDSGLDPRLARVIYNGVDFARLDEIPRLNLRQMLGLSDDAVLVGCVGNIREPKDYGTFINAATELAAASARYHFVIVGAPDDQALFESLTQQVAERSLTQRVTFTGFRPDATALLKDFDIYVLPSRVEGLSLSTIEALACRIPAVVTASGGPEEIVTDRWSGRIVPVGDSSAMAHAVKDLVRVGSAAREYGWQGAADVRARFSVQDMVQSYVHEYNCAARLNAASGARVHR